MRLRVGVGVGEWPGEQGLAVSETLIAAAAPAAAPDLTAPGKINGQTPPTGMELGTVHHLGQGLANGSHPEANMAASVLDDGGTPYERAHRPGTGS
jgi:hypothetical protein